MALTRSPPVIMLWLWLSSVSPQGSNCQQTLWGKKAVFMARPCMWQLSKEVAVPALDELSVCLSLHITVMTTWTAFAYKAPGNPVPELSLEGASHQTTATLFGTPWFLDVVLSANHWHLVCLTWSARIGKLRAYVNGTRRLETPVKLTPPNRLAADGTLTLGAPHSVDADGTVRPEDGRSLMGYISRFRMWGQECQEKELDRLRCVDGDVVRWDTSHWEFPRSSCAPEHDATAASLHCEWSDYEIKMCTLVSNTSDATNRSLEYITSYWMKSIFPRNVSVQNVSVLSPSRQCLTGNNSPFLYMQEKSKGQWNSTFDYCFSSQVVVSVSPKRSLRSMQAYITKRLEEKFPYNNLTLMADISRLSIWPVEPFQTMTEAPPIELDSPTATYNNSVDTPDSFFRVNLSLAFNGAYDNPSYIVESMIRKYLQAWQMLNFQMVEDPISTTDRFTGQMVSHRLSKKYHSAFHVQADQRWNISYQKYLISHSLTQVYSNNSLHIQTTPLEIRYIVPRNCPEESLNTIYGVYVWPETSPQREQFMICEKPPSRRASRFCKLDINSDMTSWMDPNMTACKPLIAISDLDEVNVTAENAAEVVQMIQDLINIELGTASGGDGELSASSMVTLVGKLDDVVDVSVVTSVLCDNILSVISDILISNSDMSSVANMVLNLTERIGDQVVFSKESFNVSTPALTVSMSNVNPKTFRGLTFSVSSFPTGMIPEISLSPGVVAAMPDMAATVGLPPVLQNLLVSDGNKTRIQFQFYGVQDLFNDTDITIGAEGNWTLNSYVVSASIYNSTVSNLRDQRVEVTLSNSRPKQDHETVKCVFWDFSENDGQGGWNDKGCETRVISANQTVCYCDHLTSFAVLLDLSRKPVGDKDNEVLTVISYLGCGVSSIFLGITLLTYLAFEKLRRDYPSKILINLSAALLALNLLYLLNTWLSSFPSYGLCIATAVLMHYFLLAAFMWMALEAVHMYFALIKVFNIYVLSYIFKFCLVGWGVPLVIVALVLATDVDAYGNTVAAGADQTTEPFCWIRSDVHFYVAVAAFILLVLLGNTSVLVVVLVQIRRMRTNRPSGKPASGGTMRDLRAAASLTVLLGVTWLIAFFSFGSARTVALYLFCIFNSLQGFFVFVFHCLMKDNVRKQWRNILTFDRSKKDTSDWSRSLNGSGQPREKLEDLSLSMGSVETSSIIKTSSSTGSP